MLADLAMARDSGSHIELEDFRSKGQLSKI